MKINTRGFKLIIFYKEFKQVLISIVFFNLFFIGLSLALNFFSKGLVVGSIFGAIFSFLNFFLLADIVLKSVKKSSNRAKSYISVNYFLRYILTGIFIFICVKYDSINGFIAIGNLFVPKIALYLFSMKSIKK